MALVLDPCDVAVIGGGIHGVGVAQAAAAAGHQVYLLEQTELAAGTSSKSSKLIHGGLRYLENGQISLVMESVRERELLLRLAPGLVRRHWFHIPVYPHTTRRPWLLRSGLCVYAVMAGLRRDARFSLVRRHEWDELDGLSTEGLQAVFRYSDAQTDDCLLTQAVMRSAESLGARLFCPASFVSAKITSDGCLVRFVQDGAHHECKARVLVNAAGPWANGVLQRIEPRPTGFPVDLIQGSHLELPGVVERGSYYLEVPLDKRAVFVMPWHGRTLLGTTEHAYQGDPAHVGPLEQEISYLLDVYGHFFPGRQHEVLDAWAGLRVLPSSRGPAFRRSRETQLPVDDAQRPRVVSIFGGKLTGYRVTAQKVIRSIQRSLPRRTPIARTDELPLAAEDPVK